MKTLHNVTLVDESDESYIDLVITNDEEGIVHITQGEDCIAIAPGEFTDFAAAIAAYAEELDAE